MNVSRLLPVITVWLAIAGAIPSVALADAAAEAEEAEAEQNGMSVEEILTRDPSSDDYGDSTRCINTRLIDHIEVLDEQHVIIEMSRDEIYLVRFKHRCPGLRRNKPVITEPRSGRLCRLDTMRPVFEWGIGNFEPGPACAIPGFEAITREQVEQLEAALKADKRRARKATGEDKQQDAEQDTKSEG